MKMKSIFWMLFGICLLVVVILDTVRGYQWYQAKKTMSILQLADDASMPQKKAEFLDKFISEIESQDLPKHGAFVFKTEQNKITNQIIVLESLSDRCKELVGKDPESMGYATGIQQITGQEFDHALESVGGIIYKALMMPHGWFMYYQPCISWIFPVIMLGLVFIATVEDI